MAKTISLILLTALLLISCATRAPEVEMAPVMSSELVVEEVVEAKTESSNVWYWNTTPTVVSLTDEQWDELFGDPEPVQETSAQTTIEEPVIEEPAIDEVAIVEESSEVEENPVGTTALPVTEPVKVEELQEPSAEILTCRAKEAVITEEEMSIAEIPPFKAVLIVDKTESKETISADAITELADENKALEKTDYAKPDFKNRVLKFFKEHLLFLEIGILAILVIVLAAIFIKRGKKMHAQAQVKPVLDEGEEIIMTPSYYRSPNIEVEEPIPKP